MTSKTKTYFDIDGELYYESIFSIRTFSTETKHTRIAPCRIPYIGVSHSHTESHFIPY